MCPSIVNGGSTSSDDNGFRKYLRDQLRYAGWPVNMVGSLKTGTMKDNDNEGHIGYRIQQIVDEYLVTIVKNKPNLIIMNIGTNNAGQNNGVSNWADLNIQVFTPTPPLLNIPYDHIEFLDQLFAGDSGRHHYHVDFATKQRCFPSCQRQEYERSGAESSCTSLSWHQPETDAGRNGRWIHHPGRFGR